MGMQGKGLHLDTLHLSICPVAREMAACFPLNDRYYSVDTAGGSIALCFASAFDTVAL